MHWINLVAIPLVARIFLVVLFPFSAVDKIVHWKNALQQADSSILPGAAGPPMLVLAIVVELVAPLCVVFGWHDRLAAFVLAGFCIVTALLYHPFWQYPHFWSGGDNKGRSQFWDFLKNFGLVGGLLLVVIGTQFVPASRAIEHPLSSNQLSATPATAQQDRFGSASNDRQQATNLAPGSNSSDRLRKSVLIAKHAISTNSPRTIP
ncbi:MAG: DoxX family protein [Rhodanobacteraceae bacterium]